MESVRGSERLRANTKKNYLRTFCFLYYTGLRLNEVQELRVKDVYELIRLEDIKITLSKTKSERKLYASKAFIKELKRIFNFKEEDPEDRIITKGSVKSNRSGINTIVFITKINAYMKQILGSGFTSHSFRQGIIGEVTVWEEEKIREGMNKKIKESNEIRNSSMYTKNFKYKNSIVNENIIKRKNSIME